MKRMDADLADGLQMDCRSWGWMQDLVDERGYRSRTYLWTQEDGGRKGHKKRMTVSKRAIGTQESDEEL
jgi:hypothetical protein